MTEQAEGLLALLLIGGFALTLAFLGNALTSSATRRRKCSPHRWSTNPQTNKLECTACGFVAGTHSTDHGDYGP